MRNIIYLLCVIALGSCSEQQKEYSSQVDVLSSERIENYIKTLASDEFMGRQPGSQGGEKTVNYIVSEFKKNGVAPGNGDSYTQQFDISEIKPVLPGNFVIKAGSVVKELQVKQDFIAKTNLYGKPLEILDKELVFVGFGIVAPEYNWDDYKDIDVKDKIVIAMYSDPGLYDTTMFNGLKGTPYAYIAAKQEEAKKRGAAGFFTIFHDTGPTGMNWSLVEIMATRPTYYIKGSEPDNSEKIGFGGMLSIDATKELLKMGGQSENYIESALSNDFKAVNLNMTGTITLESKFRSFSTANVVGLVKGSEKPDEVIIYTAHWDHDGIKDVPVNGDSILNGAIDNASGTAMVMETAIVMTNAEVKPKRSMLFILTSGEEMGLLGSKFYADNPIFPLHKTVSVINTDAAHATEPMRIAVDVLKGHSEMDTIVNAAAASLGRIIISDPQPEIGAFQRSDHYPLVAKGIPGVWAVGGADPMQGDSAKAMQIVYDYGATKYHQVTDEYYEGFLMGNILLDTKLNLAIGELTANSGSWPNWKEGSPYRALRDSLLNIQK